MNGHFELYCGAPPVWFPNLKISETVRLDGNIKIEG